MGPPLFAIARGWARSYEQLANLQEHTKEDGELVILERTADESSCQTEVDRLTRSYLALRLHVNFMPCTSLRPHLRVRGVARHPHLRPHRRLGLEQRYIRKPVASASRIGVSDANHCAIVRLTYRRCPVALRP